MSTVRKNVMRFLAANERVSLPKSVWFTGCLGVQIFQRGNALKRLEEVSGLLQQTNCIHVGNATTAEAPMGDV